ncbi:hypothetical protein BHE90_011632 [Fusarium euwallaceae]|uniref:Uncharacterized protein n=2 Tax=Fusarium solani species complex TaxID=232080 RepID=A0A3M2RQC1_9HYPO|nr:hypothetical protein CDV36_012913 [Fusarium kuroshium]RTE73918.1 hypothetical protein BHE90_011632 [Fusarium euwallaceae]
MDSRTSLARIFLGQPPDQLHLLNGDQVSLLDFTAYDEYVRRQQKLFKDMSSSAVSPYDEESLGKVADAIRHHKQRDRAVSCISTLADNGDSIASEATLSLVVRLILMVEIGSLEKSFGFMYNTAPCPLPQWTENDLASLARRLFPSSPQIDCSRVSIPATLDAWGLENIAGIKIEFTDNLADHLRLAKDNTQLYVFHHVAYLEHQRHISNPQNAVLPEGLAEESLRTLAILFPQSDHWISLRSTRKKRVWLGRLRANSSRTIDSRLTCCGTPKRYDRQLSNFHFWRERLVIIKEVFDESTPNSFSQWWYDRRNGVQWHNFWVAIVVLGLTAFFGLIQCILAAVQVYKAYHPS